MCESNRARRDLESYLLKLILNRDTYFDRHGYANSEGMKIISIIARIAAEDCREVFTAVKKVRSRPTYEEVLDLAEEILGDTFVSNLMEEAQE